MIFWSGGNVDRLLFIKANLPTKKKKIKINLDSKNLIYKLRKNLIEFLKL